MTAQWPSTNTDSTTDLGLISHADLTKFNTGAEHTSQIFYQFPEINSSICCKIKKQFIVVKCIFCIDQFHLKSMLVDLFITDLICFFFLFTVLCLRLFVLFGCHSQNALQRSNNLLFRHLPVWQNYRADLNTLRSLYDHVLISF